MATEQQLPPGRPYKGPITAVSNSPWLNNGHLSHEKPTEVTIEAVLLRENLTMQEGRKMRFGTSLKFVGKERELLLNSTNKKTLTLLFGSEVGEWFGKKITLFVEQNVRYADGTRGPAVRIQARRQEQEPPQ